MIVDTVDINIRAAKTSDSSALLELLACSEHRNWLPGRLSAMLAKKNMINLLGEIDGKAIGCIHGELLNQREAWLHAICINQNDQFRSLGLRFLLKLQNEFRHMGVRFIRCTVDSLNRPFQDLVTKQGWRVVSSFDRRLRKKIVPQIGRLRKSSLHQARQLTRSFPILASRANSSSSDRYYFRMTDTYLKLLVRKGAILATESNSAYAILEHDPRIFPKGIWIIGLGGTRDGICSMIRQITGCSEKMGIPLIIDGPDDPDIQEYMDEIGLKISNHSGTFSVAELRL